MIGQMETRGNFSPPSHINKMPYHADMRSRDSGMILHCHGEAWIRLFVVIPFKFMNLFCN